MGITTFVLFAGSFIAVFLRHVLFTFLACLIYGSKVNGSQQVRSFLISCAKYAVSDQPVRPQKLHILSMSSLYRECMMLGLDYERANLRHSVPFCLPWIKLEADCKV